ncbi:ParA family protein [Stenomitos frigidus]|uniref:ParA family protein n=1 Tax=Stenomitos frigidus ULC18 TaxID=2107698 RepID=A0A2T1EH37_9CYAN|nr:ParA family protein [Stenomitos frigidus]PSB32066.1 ParA family protein [Stenomitos frigidus ULC18]
MKVKEQVRLSIQSNAGGSGKTTMTVHLAYAIAAKGYTVTILELDQSGSIKRFVGLPPVPKERSMAAVLDKGFHGEYPLIQIWTEHLKNVTLIQGGASLEESIQLIISTLASKYHVLAHTFDDYPLDADVVIIDTPASLEPMGKVALAAATHLLIPIKPEYKDSDGASELVAWYNETVRELRLRPKPEIIGFVPTRVDLDFGPHKMILGLERQKGKVVRKSNIAEEETLPYQIHQLGYTCFPIVRESSEYINASGYGLPLQVYRPGNKAVQDLDPVVRRILAILENK